MVLNLITPLYRSGMLQKIKASIPNEPDINWIIVLCRDRGILKKECEDLNLKYLVLNEDETHHNANRKTNYGIENMEEGFFLGLDDDTTFNPNALNVFRKHQNYKLIIGEQLLKDGAKRPAQKPQRCYTDGGQIMVHSSIVKSVKITSFAEDPQADCKFMLDCWELTPENDILILNEAISNYNFLR